MDKLKPTQLGMALGLLSSCLMAGPLYAAADGYASLNGGTTGGEGGAVVYASTGTEIHRAMCDRASEDTPLIIYVSGTITQGNTTKESGSCDTKDNEIQFKRVSNISLIGTNEGALFDEIGIHLRESSNIIIRNVHVRNVKKSGSNPSNGGDAIGMERDVRNVWIDHNELEASGGESDGYDSLVDIKDNSRYITVSYNYMHHSGRGGLIGSSDSDDDNTFVTFHHNRYEQIDSRLPLLRHGTAHAYNNYYNGISKSGMNPRIGGRIKAENNVFENAQNPIGTFYTDDMGFWDISGNIFTNVNWLSNSTNHPAGPNPQSTTSINIPYGYSLDNASCVKSIVMATAGDGTNMATSNGDCGTSGGGGGANNGTVNGTYRIMPIHSGDALDVDGCGVALGTNIRQWGWLNNDCQRFVIQPVDGIWHRISPAHAPQLSFDVDNFSTDNGANIMLWDYLGNNNQLFRFQSAGQGRWRIINRNSELCLDVFERSSDAGANVVQWECLGDGTNQIFELLR